MEALVRERQRIQTEIARLEAEDLVLAQQELELNQANHTLRFWKRDKVGLTSYPRSGNSFLRKIIEQLTGTVTGSDGNPDRMLNQQLQQLGLSGEGKMSNDEAWCVKTHYPERVGRARLTISRFILLVRNPFDCILSFFQMMITDSHSQAISLADFTAKYSKLWGDFLLEEVSIWIQFHQHWRVLAERNPDKYLLLRYEDLVGESRAGEVTKLAKFLYQALPNSEHDTVEALTKYFASQPDLVLYPVKPHQHSKLIKSTEFYTNEQFLYVLASARSDLTRFGYWEDVMLEWNRRAGDGKELDLVPYVDKLPDECMAVHPETQSDRFWLNSRYSLRPRTPTDPYARGFDIRWEARLQAIQNPQTTTL
ncbi:hypothetical protein BASA81_001225 [Batrachochytrium salamandrivorans]|nr:hypothetical protein BASA81_001225 [Batrachochytrium salamandrivorans]